MLRTVVDFKDPNDRALMMTTSEGYETLRAALPHAAATLAAEAIGELGPRPASGENFYVDGLAQGELCVGDVFNVEGSSTVLEVSSPRRPCDKWNKVHDMAAHPNSSVENNGAHSTASPPLRGSDAVRSLNPRRCFAVRHFAITNTLGGVCECSNGRLGPL